MSDLLPGVMFSAAIVMVLIGPWWGLRRAMRREGIVPCLNYLQTQWAFVWFIAIGVPLFVLIGATMAAWRSETAPLWYFAVFVLAGCAMVAVAILIYLFPAAFELNRALTQLVHTEEQLPTRFVEATRQWVARTRWLQVPLFRLRGVTPKQVEALLSGHLGD